MHEGNETANLPFGYALLHKPAQVSTWQIGNQAPFVLAERHLTGDQKLEILGAQSAPYPLNLESFGAQQRHHLDHMVALHLDHALFNRPA